MKKMLALLLTLCLLAGMVPLGAGAVENTATVSTREGLKEALENESVSVISLQNTIDMGETAWQPVVINRELTINGNDYSISNLHVTEPVLPSDSSGEAGTGSSCDYYSGFIGWNTGKLTLNDLAFKGAEIDINPLSEDSTGSSILAVPVANNTGTLVYNNVTVDNSVVRGYTKVGLLHGFTQNGGSFTANKCSITNSNVVLEADGTDKQAAFSGIIVGYDGNNKSKTNGISLSNNSISIDNSVDWGQTPVVKDGVTSVDTWGLTCDTYTHGSYGTQKVFFVAEVDGYQYETLSDAISAATENATVRLLKDTAETVTISKDKTLTLDLNGKTLSGSMKVNGNLTIQDSATGGTISNTGKIPVDGGRLTLKSGTISVKDDYGVYVLNGGSATINGGTISSKYSALAGNNTTGDMNFVVTGGTLTAEEGPAIYMPGQITMNISGGTLNGGISLRMGQITISGGTINATNGTIDAPQNFYNYSGNAAFPDALYVLNGTYTSQNETYKNSLKLTITGGTFNCANSQGSAVAIYDLGKVAQESKVTISGDAKFSTNAVERSAYQVLTLSDIGVVSPEGGYNNRENVGKVSTSITSGYFTSDPSEYCPEGLTGLPGQYVVDGNTYQYMVGKKLENVTVATGETEAAKSEGVNIIDADVKKIGETKADGLTPEANETASNLPDASKADIDAYNKAVEALKVEGIKKAEEDKDTITTVIAPRLEIEITGYDNGTAEATEKSLTLNIEAVYDIKATTKADDMEELNDDETNATQVNTVTIKKNAGKLDTTGQEVVISIPLPDGFVSKTDPIYVQHKGYEYKADVTSKTEGTTTTYTATFTNPHGFSTFVLSTEPKAVATVDGTNYTNFQQAVDAAGVNGTVTVQKGGQTATGVTHDLKLENGTGGPITVTINGKKITINVGETETFTYTAPTPPRPTEEKHSITISTDGKGQVTGPASAAEDDKVTLTVKPNADKELYDLKVTDEDGKAIAVTKVNDTTYTFTMPDGKVTIAAAFGCDGGDNCPSKAFTDLGDKQWYHDSIDYAVENGLLEGTSPTTMEPNATLIRAQLAQILYNIEDKPAVTGEMVFEDVPASEWFYSPILWANQNEIINGTSPTTFEPLEDISRQDLALMLYRYAGKPAVTGDLDGFTDADQVGDWAEEAMAWAVAEGIVQGDTPTTLNPTGTATRAEAATMLQRFLEDAA